MTPIKSKPRVVTAEVAELDVGEFEFLLAGGESMESALARMGMCGRSMCRRYQLLNRPIPAGLWQAAEQRVKVSAGRPRCTTCHQDYINAMNTGEVTR